MVDVSMSETASQMGEKSHAQRIHLSRITIETSALLNLVKHCREADWNKGAQGNIMGVIKEDTLMVTQALPEISKNLFAELMEAMESET